MSDEIVVQQQAGVNRFDGQTILTIKQTVCKGASDAQLQMFLQVCKRTGLDPFLKEIWFVAEKSIIMAGRDGYLRVANENPMFDGIETRVERDEKNVPIKAVCTVWRKDRTHPTICEAFYSEYKSASPVWSKYPSAMISKVAEVLALKRSFAINGVVSEEEMDATDQPAPVDAPRQVAERKIAGMQSGKTYAEVSTAQPDPPIESHVEVDPAAAGIKQRLEQFAKIRAAMGDPTYYAVLGAHGFCHANEIKSLDTARAVYRELKEALDYQMTRSAV